MTPDQTPATRPDAQTALSTSLIREFDRERRGRFGMLLGGQSPWAALQAWEDWAFHLMLSSGKQIELCEMAWEAASSLGHAVLEREGRGSGPGSDSGDRRFRDP